MHNPALKFAPFGHWVSASGLLLASNILIDRFPRVATAA